MGKDPLRIPSAIHRFICSHTFLRNLNVSGRLLRDLGKSCTVLNLLWEWL